MQKYKTDSITIEFLLTYLKNGEIAIPEIQRPFVWSAKNVRDLIDSLYKGYPVGFIIIWQNDDIKLKDGTKSKSQKIIIDGQQRLTALSAALLGCEVVDANFKKKRIKIAFNPIEEKFETSNPAKEKDSKWIPDISQIWNDFDPFIFVPEYCKKNNLPESEKTKINNIVNKLKNIVNNPIGVIEISKGLDIEEVTSIFIRINLKGKVLSQADFVMSKIASNEKQNGDLIRKTIDYFCHILKEPNNFENIKNNDIDFSKTDEFKALSWVKDKNIAIYTPDYTDIIKVAYTSKFHRGKLADLVSLLSGRDFETRENKEEIVEQTYKDLKEGVMQFINKTNFERFLMIIKSVGIKKHFLINSDNVLNFGYILYISLKDKGIDSNIIEKIIRRWLLLSILTGRYSGSSETMIESDIKKFINTQDPIVFIEEVEAGELSSAFWNNVLINKLNTASTSSSIFNIFIMAQIKDNNKAFLSKDIDTTSIIEGIGDKHHLFPKNYLIKHGKKQEEYNQIANFVICQQEINIKIKDKSPKEYMDIVYKQFKDRKPELCNIIDENSLKQNFEENCIPEGFKNMIIDDYDDFLIERRKLIAEKIRKYYESLK